MGVVLIYAVHCIFSIYFKCICSVSICVCDVGRFLRRSPEPRCVSGDGHPGEAERYGSFPSMSQRRCWARLWERLQSLDCITVSLRNPAVSHV